MDWLSGQWTALADWASSLSWLGFVDAVGNLTAPYAAGLKYAIPASAIVLLVIYSLIRRRPAPALRGVLAACLVALALLSVVNYTQMGRYRYGNFLNAYEFYHYYLGSKYAPEIGYTNLYPASLVADEMRWREKLRPEERGQREYKLPRNDIRNLENMRHEPYKKFLDEGAKYKALFSEARWKQWSDDVAFFRGRVQNQRWADMHNDKGYNGTPVASMVNGTLAEIFTTDSPAKMNFLAALDLVMIGCAGLCVAWAFGPRAALLFIAFIGTHMLMSHSHMKGAFMRTDFTMAMVAAVCFLKKEHYVLAGVFTAYSILARVFPAVFLFGLGALGLWALLRIPLPWLTRRKGEDGAPYGARDAWREIRPYVLYFSAVGATVGILVFLSIVWSRGLYLWEDFASKIGRHNNDISPWRVGFKYIYMHALRDWYGYTGSLKQTFESTQPLWWSIQAGMLGICFLLARSLKPHEALTFSFVPVFFMVAPTYYYFIMLAIPFLFFAGQLDRPTRAFGLILMFATSMLLDWTHDKHGFSARQIAWAGSLDSLLKSMNESWGFSLDSINPGWRRDQKQFIFASWLILGMVVYMALLVLGDQIVAGVRALLARFRKAPAEQDGAAAVNPNAGVIRPA